MKYANLLRDAVVQSNWTYSKIINKCKDQGVTFSSSYLSKLCTGMMPPPSDEINRVIAEVLAPVTSITYEQLAIAKYKEIIPTEILEAIAAGQ
jgi:hypothetical protein